MAKITQILIGMVVVSMVVGLLAIFLTAGSEEYGFDDYNNTEITTFNKMTELADLSNETRVEESKFSSEGEGAPDILGSIFNNGYKVLRVTTSSIDIANSIVSESLDSVGLGSGVKNLLKLGIMTMIVIVIIIGIIIAAIVKRDL